MDLPPRFCLLLLLFCAIAPVRVKVAKIMVINLFIVICFWLNAFYVLDVEKGKRFNAIPVLSACYIHSRNIVGCRICIP